MSQITIPRWVAFNESIPVAEEAAIQTVVQLIEDSVRAEAKNAPARRDAHAKAHGCVKAQFRVLDNLPEALQVGIFAEANSYPAWIRYSNGSGKCRTIRLAMRGEWQSS